MSEMLGNYYFQIRNFKSALTEFESSLSTSLENSQLKKKLVICYVQQKKTNNALKLFIDIISKDISIITSSMLREKDCPCPQLIYDIENGSCTFKSDFNKFVALGILWLYCEINTSLKYFFRAKHIAPQNKKLEKAISIISQNKSLSLNDR